MKNLISTLVLLMLVVTACSTEEPVEVSVKDAAQPLNTFKVPLNRALEQANVFMSRIEKPATRGTSRSVESVSVITEGALTRSASQDTLLYVVNYNDNLGFAILGADMRLPSVYAISDEGNLDVDDVKNEGLRIVLDRLKADAVWRLDHSSVSEDDLAGVSDDFAPTTRIVKVISPMVSERQNRIGWDNCSSLTVNDKGEPALTCCVPIAVEVVMSYYKWPASINNYPLNWDQINAGNDETGLAYIIGVLSDRDHCHVTNNDATHIGGAYHGDVPDVFVKCGYYHPGNYKYFFEHEDEAQSALDNGPLLMHAWAAPNSGYTSGHMWVVDGLAIFEQDVLSEIGWGVSLGPVWTVETFTYYHCIWGDAGTTNGYYLVADHGFNGAPDYHDPIDLGDDSSAGSRIYNTTSVKFLANFKINQFQVTNDDNKQ